MKNNVSQNMSNYEKLLNFEKLANSGIKLKTNQLYNFLRNFGLSLNSNSNGKVAKIFEILEHEETALKASSSIANFISDGIRDSDLLQAIDTLKIVQAVINAMSTTEVDFGDPYGFIMSRQTFAKRNGIDDEVSLLKVISSSNATLMSNDIQKLITKLQFIYDLAENNAGKMINEQESIRKSMDSILLKKWSAVIKKLPIAFLPKDQVESILGSTDSDKLMHIENLLYDTNKNKKSEALAEILKPLSISPDDFSKIDREVTESSIKD